MSRSYRPYLVDESTVRIFIGSKDETLALDLNDRYGEWFDRGEQESPSLRQAMFEVLHGEIGDQTDSAQHWLAVEILCAHLGRRLPADGWQECPLRWEQQVERALADVGLEKYLSIEKFMMVTPSFGLPASKRYPKVGFLERGRIGSIRQQIPEFDLRPVPEDSAKAIRSMIVWLAEAARNAKDLVIFAS
jgi:hypothetical protein